MDAQAKICEILERLASEIENAPVRLVGGSVSVTAGPGGGSATGLSISVVSGAKGTHTVGMSVTVDSGKYAKDASDLVRDIREAAEAAKQNQPAKGWLKSLLDRAKALPNVALQGIIGNAAYELAKIYGAF